MIKVGEFSSISCRLFVPSVGVWLADVDLDLDGKPAPSGKVKLEVGGKTLIGTVDPTHSGKHGDKYLARIVAGGNGWQKNVTAQQFHNDAGVLSTGIFEATAAQVGETVNVVSPVKVGSDYERTEGPAMRVLSGTSWFVDFDGVTQIGERSSSSLPKDADILSFDPLMRVATIATSELFLPGAKIEDDRFGSLVAREIEFQFNAEGARALVYCETGISTSTNRLSAAFAKAAREAVGAVYLSPKRYRIVQQNLVDKRLTLQPVKKETGVPDSIAISIWPGFQGLGGKLTPGVEVLVEFINGDPKDPIVRSFANGSPIELELTATLLATVRAATAKLVGTVAASVEAPVATLVGSVAAGIAAPIVNLCQTGGIARIGGGSSGVVRGTQFLAWAAQVTTAVNLLAPGSITALPAAAVSEKLLTD